MSFIRSGQDSKYVDLGEGSRAYLYSNGHAVSGTSFEMTYSEWIDSLCKHAELAGVDSEGLERSLENHYGEPRGDVDAVGPRPEMAHVLAQHFDQRLDDYELTDDMLESLQEHAENAFNSCTSCNSKWRDSPYTPEEQRENDLCDDCYNDYLYDIDVTCDTGEMRSFVESLPTQIPPTDEDDDEFYALTMEEFTSKEGISRNALAHQLGDAADEVMDAVVEERPVNKEKIFDILDSVSE